MNIASITFATPSAAPDAAAGAALLGAFGHVLDATLQPAAATAFGPSVVPTPAAAAKPVAAAEAQPIPTIVTPGPEDAVRTIMTDIPPISAELSMAPEQSPLPEPTPAAAQPDAQVALEPVAKPAHYEAKPIPSDSLEPVDADTARPLPAPAIPASQPQAEAVATDIAPPAPAAIEPAAPAEPQPTADAQPQPAAGTPAAMPAPAPHLLTERTAPAAESDGPAAIAAKAATSASAPSAANDAAPATAADSGRSFAAAVAASADVGDNVAPKADGLPSSLLSQALPAQAARPAVAHPYPAQADAAPVIHARPGQIGYEMGVEIARRVSAGREEVTIRLNPIEMGRIEVRMAFDDAGSLRAVVAAESPAALDMLRRDAADLTRALTDAGIRSDAQSFRFDSRSGGDSQAWQRQQSGGEQRAGDGRFASGDTPEGDEPQYRPLRSSGQIDLMA